MSHVLPPELLVEPLSRPVESRTKAGKLVKQDCKTCGRNYVYHSLQCAICGQYVEHHDAESAAGCIDGRARMARARFLADVPLTDVDRFCLSYGSEPRVPGVIDTAPL